MNEWCPLVPCLHRLHDPNEPPEPGSAHHIQLALGMSISVEDVVKRLEVVESQLVQRNEMVGLNQRMLVTFDDGYRDVLHLRPFFRHHETFKPVLFISSILLSTGSFTNWFDILYTLTAARIENGATPQAVMGWLKRERFRLRGMLHQQQMEHLLELAGTSLPQPDGLYLDPSDISLLKEDGFLMASHGVFHHDLTLLDDKYLRQELYEAWKTCRDNHSPAWLAWPDGRFDARVARYAIKIGFEYLFDISGSTDVFGEGGLVSREVW